MSGSVNQCTNGTWQFVADLGGDPLTGKRRQVRRRGFKTKKEASAALHEFAVEARQGLAIPSSGVTVSRYLIDTWLPSISTRVRATTADSYKRLVMAHIVTAFGEAKLQSLDEPTIEQWVVQLSQRGLSPKSVRNIHAVLSKSLADAMRLRLVSRNVATRALLPKATRPAPRAWTADQLRTFLAHVADDRWAAMWRLLATTGMRRGEVLGVRWQDIDLASGTLTVRQQRTIAGGSVIEGPPKTSSGSRTIALDTGTVASLKAWRKVQNAERLAMGAGWQDTGGLVYTWPDGGAPWPQAVTAWFKTYCETLDLPAVGVHGLRHTAATWLIASGESPKLVAQRLGHAHVNVTLQLYSHVMPSHDRSAAEALAFALDRIL